MKEACENHWDWKKIRWFLSWRELCDMLCFGLGLFLGFGTEIRIHVSLSDLWRHSSGFIFLDIACALVWVVWRPLPDSTRQPIPEYNVQKASLIPAYNVLFKESCDHDQKNPKKNSTRHTKTLNNLWKPLEATPVVYLQHVLWKIHYIWFFHILVACLFQQHGWLTSVTRHHIIGPVLTNTLGHRWGGEASSCPPWDS